MPKNTAYSTYYEKLDRTQKLEFLFNYVLCDGQMKLDDERKEELAGLTKDYFMPKDAKGELDISEMQSRLGELLLQRSLLEEQFGLEVQKLMQDKEAMKDVPENEREAAAILKATKESVAGMQLNYINRFIHKDLFGKGYLSDEACNAFLKGHGIKVKTARTKENMAAAIEENHHAFLDKIEEAYAGVKMIHEKALSRPGKEANKAAYLIAHKYPVVESTLSEAAKKYAVDKKAAKEAEFTKAEFIRGLDQKFDYAVMAGNSAEALDASVNPNVISKVHGILRSTGAGGTWWHQNNNEEFDDVLKYLKSYDDAAKKGADPAELKEAGQSFIKVGLAYIDGKEKVRSSQFGKDRFDAVMTALSVVMDRADFQALCDKVNKKRGVYGKKSHADYVKPENYLRKASAFSRRLPVYAEMEKDILKDEIKYAPISSDPKKDSFDLTNIKGIGNKPVTGRDFAAIAAGIANTKNPDPRADVYAALVKNDGGDKKQLAELITKAFKNYCKEANGSDEISKKWIKNGEAVSTLLEWMEKDPALAEEAKKAGLTQDDIAFGKGLAETSKLIIFSETAEKKLSSGVDMTEAEKRKLYTDYMKLTFIATKFEKNMFAQDYKGDYTKDINDLKMVYRNAEAKEKALNVFRGEKRTYSEMIKDMSKPEVRKALDAACKNAVKDLKPEKLSFNKASSAITNLDFQSKTLTNAFEDQLKNAAPKAQAGGPAMGN